MNKPPLIRTVTAQAPATRTLTMTRSTGETLPVDVPRLIKRYR